MPIMSEFLTKSVSTYYLQNKSQRNTITSSYTVCHINTLMSCNSAVSSISKHGLANVNVLHRLHR